MMVSNIIECYMLGLLSSADIIDVCNYYQHHQHQNRRMCDDDNNIHHEHVDDDGDSDALSYRMYELYHQLHDSILSIDRGIVMYNSCKHHITIGISDDNDTIRVDEVPGNCDNDHVDDDDHCDNKGMKDRWKVNWLDLLNNNTDVMKKIQLLNNNSKRHKHDKENNCKRQDIDSEDDMICATTNDGLFNTIHYSLLYYHIILPSKHFKYWCLYHMQHMTSIEVAIMVMYEQLAIFSLFDFNFNSCNSSSVLILYYIDTIIQCIDQLVKEQLVDEE